MFSIAPISPLGDLSTMLVPTGTSPVHFFWDYRDSSSNDELGYFFVDGPDGRITKRAGGDPEGAAVLTPNGLPQYVRPGDQDYAATALASANSAVAFSSGEVPNHGKLDKILDVAGDHFIAFYIVQNATTDAWRTATNKPSVWFSIGNANADNYEHFQTTSFLDPFYHRGLTQYKVEDSNILLAKRHVAGNDLDLNDVVFSVNILPFANEDDYSVFNAGNDFSGKPQGFKLSTPDDTKNQGLGLLWNDYLPSHPFVKPTVSDISIDGGDTWISVVDKAAHRTKVTVTSSSVLHGTVTVYPNGGVDFQPDVNDSWWNSTPITSDADPDAIEFEYRISDGIDTAESSVTVTHGFYQRGGPVDNKHNGQQMYLLAGGGSSAPFDAGRQRFFQEGSQGQDILLIAQGTEQREFVNDVFDYYAAGKSRSVTSLNITTREQANDPRLSRYVNGADAIWFGGGAQSTYQSTWIGTQLFTSLARAAANNVAIGGTSAGMAILSQAAYVDIPWDSVQSSFATERMFDPRVNIAYQGAQLPFYALAYSSNAPLNNFITDTHFSARDRMGRLLAFAAKSHTRGLGVDEDTALLISKVNGQWNWSVYGDGSVYLLAPPSDVHAKIEFGGRLTLGPVNVYKLSAGSQNLNNILHNSPSYRVWVSKGTVYTTDNGGSLY